MTIIRYADSINVFSNEYVDFDDPKEVDDPRYLMIQREFQFEVWTLIIQKSTVIPPSSMVLLLLFFGFQS